MEDHKTLTPEIISTWSQEKAANYLAEARSTGIAWDISKEIMAALNKVKFGEAYIGPEKRKENEALIDAQNAFSDFFNAKAIECATLISTGEINIANILPEIELRYNEVTKEFEKVYKDQQLDFDFYHVVFNQTILQLAEKKDLSEEIKKELLSLKRKTSIAVTKKKISSKEVPFETIYEITNLNNQ